MSEISCYHAHVYYDESTFEQASGLCDRAGALFNVDIGHKHRQLVGPHPRWSCQLTLTPEQFGDVLPWLMLNRNGLTIFTHAETGDMIRDHTEHTIWMGEMLPLNMDILQRFAKLQRGETE